MMLDEEVWGALCVPLHPKAMVNRAFIKHRLAWNRFGPDASSEGRETIMLPCTNCALMCC